MLRSVPIRKVSRDVMKRQDNPASVRIDVAALASFLAREVQAIGLECGGKLASDKRSETGIIYAHPVTATSGRSDTDTLGGTDPPSNSSSIAI